MDLTNMSRPLLITDCDEVLLHMVGPFGVWLDEDHQIHFKPNGAKFDESMRYKASGEVVPQEKMWPLLDGFFETEMHRQTLIPHAREALAEIAEHADIVVLTNLTDNFNAPRVEQLKALGIHHRVVTNQGGKGRQVKALLAEYKPTTAVFVDDLAHQHQSVAEHAPEVFRVHLIGESALAPQVEPAEHAHARIDDWQQARNWIMDRFKGVAL
jgi:ribonucleotide monophosphatase NagD (HAD superfamily)